MDDDKFQKAARGEPRDILKQSSVLDSGAVPNAARGIVPTFGELDSPADRILREHALARTTLAASEMQRMYEETIRIRSAADRIKESFGISENIAQQARRASMELQRVVNLNLLPAGEELRTIQENLSFARDLFSHPGMKETLGILGRVKASDIFPSELLRQEMDFSERLRESITGLSGPWARKGFEVESLSAIARLETFGYQIDAIAPFSPDTSALLRNGFGDWRTLSMPDYSTIENVADRIDFYRETGFDEDLADFPAESFDEILSIAGVSHPSLSAGIDDDQRAQIAYSILRALERRLRDVIERQLEGAFGDRWMKTGIHKDTRTKWREKQQWDEKNGRPPRPRLIDYADLGDLRDIVVSTNNWTSAFASFFRDRDDFRESMRRMMPVRNVTMHSGIITMEDELLLRYEAKRIFVAID